MEKNKVISIRVDKILDKNEIRWRIIEISENKEKKVGRPVQEKSFNGILQDIALFDKNFEEWLSHSTGLILEKINGREISVLEAIENYSKKDLHNAIFDYWKSLSRYQNYFTKWISLRIRTILYEESRDKSNQEIESLFLNSNRVKELKKIIRPIIEELLVKENDIQLEIDSEVKTLGEKYNNESQIVSITIKELIETLKSGQLRVPSFQRDYVWKTSMISELYNSLSQGYPIGNILVSTGIDFETKNIFIEQLNVSKNNNAKKFFVLDGQQRITSIALLLHSHIIWEKLKSQVRNQEYDEARSKLRDVENLLFWCDNNSKSILSSNMTLNKLKSNWKEMNKLEKNKMFQRLSNNYEQIINPILNREIPVIIVPFEKDDLLEIFKRINTKGTTLSNISLLHAAFYGFNNEFELTKKLSDIKSNNIKKILNVRWSYSVVLKINIRIYAL